MKIKSIYILLFFLLVLSNTHDCNSQSQSIFEKINRSNGLSNSRISSIVKEKNGFVWIGTRNGLNRYDGTSMKVYNKQNSKLSTNDVSDLFIDSKGRIWIATWGGGLNLYNALKDTFVTYKFDENNLNSIASNEVNTIFEDSKGNLWLGTEKGLSLFNEAQEKFISYRSKSNVKGNLWLGTFGGGLNKFIIEEGVFVPMKSSDEISANFIHAIGGLDKNRILVGTNGDGLLVFDMNSLQFSRKELKSKETIKIIRCIKKDRDGVIWIGTDGNGLFKMVDVGSYSSNIYNYTNNSQLESSISSNAIYDVMKDENSNVWIGTAWNGVNVLNQNKEYKFLQSTTKEESTSPVLSVYKNNNHFFLGLDGKGLTVLQIREENIKRFSRYNGKLIGGDYMGTFVNGLINFNPRTEAFTQYKHKIGDSKSLSYNDVRYIVEEGAENLWVATWGGGLNYFNIKTKEFQSFRKQEGDSLSISSDNIFSMQKDGDSLWLGTFGGGINLFDTKTKKSKQFRYSEHNSNTISSDYIYSVLKDSRGNLWVGTSGEGINLYNKKLGTFNYQIITAIIEDNNGLIWFSTKQGIFNYNYNEDVFKRFTDLSGEYHINAAFKDEKGLLYFGGAKGVITFNPRTIINENINPKVKLTSLKLFNEKVPIGEKEILKKNIDFTEEIVLKHNLDVITFEFAAMQFPISTNCEYAIQLENFDKNWRYLEKDRTATFTNLSPGDYTFKVKSRIIGSDWGEENTSVKVKILKPFWLEWWAFLIYGAFVVLAFYLFRRYIVIWEQMKSNLELEKLTHEKDIEFYNLKQQFFTNISHEIRTPVTLILGSVNKLIAINSFKEDKQLNSVSTLKKNSKHLLNLVNELLDFRKLEFSEIQLKVTEENWVVFCKETYLSFVEMAEQKNIDFSFDASGLETNLWFDKNQMDKVLYNLLSNAFKYTRAKGSVKLSLSETNEHAILILKDEGVGIAKNQLSNIFNRFYQTQAAANVRNTGFGLGLSISKEIIDLHHGNIKVDSTKGLGTTFTLTLKKGKQHFKEDELGGNESNAELIDNYLIDEQKEPKYSSSDLSVAKDQTLLVVEDNKEIRSFVKELLFNEYNILEAKDGKEGLKIAKNSSPDLIISDIMMPIMNGIELTRKLKTDMVTSHIPVILLTARASFAHQMEGFNIGADEYVTKPFNELLLRTRIKNLLRNRNLLHEKFRSREIVPISKLTKNKTDQEFLTKLGQLIDKHMGSDKMNASFVAQELGMSHSVVYKKLKVLTNLSLIEYVRDYKLKTAKKLIQEKNFSVKDAAYHIGYSDQKYFSKLFKHRFGANPSSFLNKK